MLKPFEAAFFELQLSHYRASAVHDMQWGHAKCKVKCPHRHKTVGNKPRQAKESCKVPTLQLSSALCMTVARLLLGRVACLRCCAGLNLTVPAAG